MTRKIFFSFISIFTLNAQDIEPVEWEYDVNKISDLFSKADDMDTFEIKNYSLINKNSLLYTTVSAIMNLRPVSFTKSTII